MGVVPVVGSRQGGLGRFEATSRSFRAPFGLVQLGLEPRSFASRSAHP
jgi:hypothetical protein